MEGHLLPQSHLTILFGRQYAAFARCANGTIAEKSPADSVLTSREAMATSVSASCASTGMAAAHALGRPRKTRGKKIAAGRERRMIGVF